MNKTVLLISLQKDLDTIGLKSLHNYLLVNSYHSNILFMPESNKSGIGELEAKRVCDFVDKLSPLFIAISIMSTEYQTAIELSRILKIHAPSIPLVWGGIHPTIAPETCLDHIDFGCIGEGEQTLLDLANALNRGIAPHGINNLFYRGGNGIIKNPLYPTISDLNTLPDSEHIPKNSHILHGDVIERINIKSFRKYSRYSGTTYSAITSRGCPFSCSYCCNNALAAIYGVKEVRFRDSEGVIRELRKAVVGNPFIRQINFQDDCFLARSNSDLKLFCDLYKKEVNRPFVIRSIPTFVTEDKIATLKSAGLAWVSLGLQSGSDRVCSDVYNRKSLRKDFLKAANIIKKYDIAAFYDVILDNPFETEQDQLQTIETLTSIPKPFYTQYFSLSFYPGTELRERAEREGLIDTKEYQTKDYLLYSKSTTNKLVRLSAFVPASWMESLLNMHHKNQKSIAFKANMALAKVITLCFFEPLMYVRVIWLSQNKSIPGHCRSSLFT
jgi:radical SAM superfamily enzyme YgiQ (UPF0313 family)